MLRARVGNQAPYELFKVVTVQAKGQMQVPNPLGAYVMSTQLNWLLLCEMCDVDAAVLCQAGNLARLTGWRIQPTTMSSDKSNQLNAVSLTILNAYYNLSNS